MNCFRINGHIFLGLVRWISEIRENLSESRYYIYLYVAPSKILLFVVLAAVFTNFNAMDFFENAFGWWNDTFEVTIYDVSKLIHNRSIQLKKH